MRCAQQIECSDNWREFRVSATATRELHRVEDREGVPLELFVLGLFSVLLGLEHSQVMHQKLG